MIDQPEKPRRFQFGMSTLLMLPVLFALYFGLELNDSSRGLIIPVFGSLLGAVGAFHSPRRTSAMLWGAAICAAITGFVLGVARAAITGRDLEDVLFAYGNWRTVFATPFLCAAFATPFGLISGWFLRSLSDADGIKFWLKCLTIGVLQGLYWCWVTSMERTGSIQGVTIPMFATLFGAVGSYRGKSPAASMVWSGTCWAVVAGFVQGTVQTALTTCTIDEALGFDLRDWIWAFGTPFVAALVAAHFGLLAAWVLHSIAQRRVSGFCTAAVASLAILGLAALFQWWVTWPERTAREFIRLMAEHRFDEARVIIAVDPRMTRGLDLEGRIIAESFVKPIWEESRTFQDLCFARKRFELTYVPAFNDYSFTVQRGKVQVGSCFYAFPYIPRRSFPVDLTDAPDSSQ